MTTRSQPDLTPQPSQSQSQSQSQSTERATHPAAYTAAAAVTPGAVLPADDFKALFRGHPGGVAVVTADDGNGPVAMTVTSVASVSVDPPLLVFSVSELSSAAPTILAADTVVVHLLDVDDIDLARLGATSGVDRFADTARWTRLASGEPRFHGVRAWVRCAVVGRLDAGGSTVVAAQALQSSVERTHDDSSALVYHDRTWHRLSADSRL